MNETDDRLVGDPVWELFPDPSTDTKPDAPAAIYPGWR